MNRIIVRPPKVYLSDYIGDFNYLPSLIRQAKHEPMPTLYDVKQLTTLYGILPFGSEKVHETAPQVKGLLICGPKGCGKHMLLHAIVNELGANLFDITPQNIYETYREKEGIKMLMHLCSKVGKALQPTVIFIDNCEKLYKKKLKAEEKQVEKDFSSTKNNFSFSFFLISVRTETFGQSVAKMVKNDQTR